jgi:hypothetical protein
MEKQPQNLARRKFVKVLTAAGLSTALAHSLVGQALAQSQGVSDLDVLNLALTAEYLATDAYTRALTVNFPGEIRDYLSEALKHDGSARQGPDRYHPGALQCHAGGPSAVHLW